MRKETIVKVFPLCFIQEKEEQNIVRFNSLYCRGVHDTMVFQFAEKLYTQKSVQ